MFTSHTRTKTTYIRVETVLIILSLRSYYRIFHGNIRGVVAKHIEIWLETRMTIVVDVVNDSQTVLTGWLGAAFVLNCEVDTVNTVLDLEKRT